MHHDIGSFFKTPIFWSAFSAYVVASLLKTLGNLLDTGKVDFHYLTRLGGMPSAHSATVASLATVVGLYYGFKTIPFLMALIICLITMFDAAGVRRHLGRQGKILNEILDEFYAKGAVPEKRLKELLGHTPFEVLAGAFMGIVIGIIFCG